MKVLTLVGITPEFLHSADFPQKQRDVFFTEIQNALAKDKDVRVDAYQTEEKATVLSQSQVVITSKNGLVQTPADIAFKTIAL